MEREEKSDSSTEDITAPEAEGANTSDDRSVHSITQRENPTRSKKARRVRYVRRWDSTMIST